MDDIKLVFEESHDGRFHICVSGGETYVIDASQTASGDVMFGIHLPRPEMNYVVGSGPMSGFGSVGRAIARCYEIERAWKSPEPMSDDADEYMDTKPTPPPVVTHPEKTWTEPTMTKAETPSGPVFTYSGAMPDETPETVWIPDEMPKVSIPVPVMTGKTEWKRPPVMTPAAVDIRTWPRATPYTYREKIGILDMTLTFLTCDEMTAYAEKQRKERPQ